MEKSSFFNAELVGDIYDRTYLAEDYAKYFSSFIGNGVFPNPSTNLQAIADSTNMNITLKTGKAWINGYFYENTDILTLPISAADGVLNRIDRIVLRLDFLNREIKCYVKKGTFASTPVAQVLQRDADMYEIGIADIAVNKGAIKITQANITDLRQNNSLCGIVHGTVEQLDVTTLFNQYSAALSQKEAGFEAEFKTWFDSIKGQLSGDVAGNLQNQINQTNAHLGEMNTKIESSKPQIGDIKTFAYIPPIEWLPCDGRRLSKTTYPELFNVVGYKQPNILMADPIFRKFGLTSDTLYNAVAYGYGKFVVGYAQKLYYSTDFITWIAYSVVATGITTPTCITFDNGIFLCGGQAGSIMRSVDGINWTSITITGGTDIYSIKYKNGVWLTVTQNNVYISRDNGLTWNSTNPPTFRNPKGLAMGETGCVLLGTNTINSTFYSFTTTDFITWKSNILSSIYSGNGFTDLTYSDDTKLYLAVTSEPNGALYSSLNGIQWTLINNRMNISGQASKIFYFKEIGMYGIVQLNNIDILLSVDLKKWYKKTTTTTTTSYAQALAYGDGLLVSVGTANMFSSTGELFGVDDFTIPYIEYGNDYIKAKEVV
ncbi:MAG: phage tail protein [Clostridium sp.]|uniref:phage tail protein n=1 Tax=Clostridium sp. TaxID=1506 RepID=UPI003217C7BB